MIIFEVEDYLIFNIYHMEGKLQKPVFVKVSSLQNSRDGYNVYVKVVSTQQQNSQNQAFDMIRAVVADQTGCANAFFKGDNAKLVKKDSVIAIRNGRIRIVKDHISLEVDIFGRITEQKVEIKPNTTNNISEKQIKRRPRTNKPRRQGQDRGDDYQRRPRRQQGDRRPRRQQGEGRRQQGDRRPRRQQGQRRPRRQQGQGRQGRRQQGDRRPRRQQGDRRPRRQQGDDDRRPRRQESNKPKMDWTQIGAIQPGQQGLNLMVKVLSVENVKNRVRVVIGDETGKVKGFFFENEAIKEGNTVVIFRAQACVVKQHIQLQLMKGGRIEQSRNKKIKQVDDTVDISAKAWVESA